LIGAVSVVEVGTGSGLSALWLLQGMAPDAVVTSIDPEAEHHRLARQAFLDAGEPTRRTRLIPGRPHEVLPRLTDGGYDIVLLDRDPRAWSDYAGESRRLLRPGGLLLAHGALWGDKVTDPAIRDNDTVAVREFLREVSASEDFESVLLPVGSGLFAAQLR
jgi:predicted O-methyltransferase YrrM